MSYEELAFILAKNLSIEIDTVYPSPHSNNPVLEITVMFDGKVVAEDATTIFVDTGD